MYYQEVEAFVSRPYIKRFQIETFSFVSYMTLYLEIKIMKTRKCPFFICFKINKYLYYYYVCTVENATLTSKLKSKNIKRIKTFKKL